MIQDDRQEYIERYERRVREFGYSPEALGWGKKGRQEVRFGVLCRPILKYPNSSVLDVGCGFGDFYDYLVALGWSGSYCGVDLVPGLLKIAKERHPRLDLRNLDITADDLKLDMHDFVIASGLFNANLSSGENFEQITKALRNMYHLSRIAVCVDFMSTYVDFQHPQGWHTDPGWAFALAKSLSKRVMLRHDYMPFEFALMIYKDDSISDRNVFNSTETAIKLGKPI